LYILRTYDLFHILRSLLHSYRSIECAYAHVCVCLFVGFYVYGRTVSNSVSTSTSMVPSDRLPPSLSTSTPMKIPDPWLNYVSVFLKENERTPEKTDSGSWWQWTSNWRRYPNWI